MALDSTGAVHAWGSNSFGQLGNNTATDSSIPINVSSFGTLSGKTIVAIACGFSYTMALDSTGAVHAWGSNSFGQLGNNTATDSSIPINVSSFGTLSGKTIVAIACGSNHTIALDSTGAVHTWGYNNVGQLGNNTTTNSNIPINVSSFGTLSGKRIVAIAGGNLHTIAIDSTGAVHAWGDNDNSQLGDNTTTNKTTPYQVSGSFAPAAANPIFINFTGQHRCFVDSLVPSVFPEHEGLVVVTDKNKYVTPDLQGRRAIGINTALPLVSLSRQPYDRRVFGVISMTPDHDTTSATPEELEKIKEQGDTRVEINSIGEGAVWVCDEAGPEIQAGDCVTSSSVPGYAMRQLEKNGNEADDIIRTYTVAKMTMECDFEPPMIEVKERAKDEHGNPKVDTEGMPVWETVTHIDADGNTVPVTEPAFEVRYLQVDGAGVKKMTKDEYESRKAAGESGLYRAAFLGCTYHCG
jgi:hypothetical protein